MGSYRRIERDVGPVAGELADAGNRLHGNRVAVRERVSGSAKATVQQRRLRGVRLQHRGGRGGIADAVQQRGNVRSVELTLPALLRADLITHEAQPTLAPVVQTSLTIPADRRPEREVADAHARTHKRPLST